MSARLLIGDVRERLEQLDDGSIDLVMTSPPFLALRSYLPADHRDKALEIGSERTPAEFIGTLLDLTAELGRVLAPHGTLCVELGDTYAGSGGAGGDYRKGGMRSERPGFDGSGKHQRRSISAYPRSPLPDAFKGGGPGGYGWPLPKSLTGIPTLYAWSLAYGRNLLTGEPSPAGQWRIRNLVHWVRPNPPVGALGDKFRPATSYLIVACRSSKRWFDLDAVRQPPSPNTHGRTAKGADGRSDLPSQQRDGKWSSLPQNNYANPAGAPPLDWWKLTARGYKGSHYAVFPPELCERPIKAMCPPRVCTVCGEPSRRLTQKENDKAQRLAFAAHLRERREARGLLVKDVARHFPSASGGLTGCVSNWELACNVPTPGQWPILRDLLGLSNEYEALVTGDRRWTETTTTYEMHGSNGPKSAAHTQGPSYDKRATAIRSDLGWSDCGHDAWRPGVVLDPFAGTGTALMVAAQHDRDGIGIDLDIRNAALAHQRLAAAGIVLDIDYGLTANDVLMSVA